LKTLFSFSRLLTDRQQKIAEDIFHQTIEPLLHHLIIYICKQCNDKGARNYAQQQLNDIQHELKRIRCIINYYILKESNGLLRKIFTTDHSTEIKMLTNKSGRFTNEDYQRCRELVQKFKSETFDSEFNLIKEQFLSIIDTVEIETGHWFVCQNNHIYNIDEVRILQFLNEIPLILIVFFREMLVYITITVLHVYQKTMNS
jgi:hypothetical protein